MSVLCVLCLKLTKFLKDTDTTLDIVEVFVPKHPVNLFTVYESIQRDVLRLQLLNHRPALCPDVLLINRTQELSVLEYLPVCRNAKETFISCY